MIKDFGIRKNEKGQSTIELLVTLTLVFAIIFLYVKQAWNITNGYMVHYATFMAGRSYLVFDNNSNEPGNADNVARSKASEVFSKYMIGNLTSSLQFNQPNEAEKQKAFTGVWYEYEESFSFSDLVGGRDPVTYRSESFLGREPSRAECLQMIDANFSDSGWGTEPAGHITFFDNGC